MTKFGDFEVEVVDTCDDYLTVLKVRRRSVCGYVWCERGRV